MPASIIIGEDIEAYHACECVSSSKLKVFNDKGPWFFRGSYITRTIPKPEPTEALIFGQAFDVAMTDSMASFEEKYVIKPQGMSFARKDGMAWRDQHAGSGQIILTYDQWLAIDNMRKNIMAHPLYSVLVHKQIQSQTTIRSNRTQWLTGIQARPDWYSPIPCAESNGLPYIVDLKTTADWSDWFDESDPESQQNGKPICTYGYHRQAAIVQWCLAQADVGATESFLLVAEKEMPYRVGVVKMSESFLEAGWNEVEHDLERLRYCIANNYWPNGPEKVVSVGPPKWLLDRANRMAVTV